MCQGYKDPVTLTGIVGINLVSQSLPDPPSKLLTGLAKGLPQLLHNPRASWVFRYIEMEDPAPIGFDDKETIQDSKGEGRHGEEIHEKCNHSRRSYSTRAVPTYVLTA